MVAQAEIITIGDEILIGQVVDTNSAWISKELNDTGMQVKQITSITDNKEHIEKALDEALARAELVLITGGLGPTRDDITKKSLAEYFHSGMYLDETAYKNVEEIFRRFNRPMLETNRQQAMLPSVCRPLYNPVGTAPGMMFEKDGRVIISMPGVPAEMKAIMNQYVLPLVRERFSLPYIIHKTIVTAGIGESFLAEAIKEVEDKLPAHIRLAYLPHLNTVRLRFSASGFDRSKLELELEQIVSELRRLIEEYIVAESDSRIQEVIGQLFTERGLSVGTVESCTGGYIAHLLTSIPGSSMYYNGSLVTYANELKTGLAGVDSHTIEAYGAVSEETVKEMAEHGRQALGVDYCIATSGIAGPGGGSEEKPVGLVWVAVAGKENTVATKNLFRGNREQVIERAAVYALDLLRKLVLKK